jgi:glycosyltransferase involved in cell wall biosynthesis
MTSVIMAVHSDYVHDRRVRNQATSLVEAGYDVTVLCVAQKHDETSAGTTSYTLDGVRLIVHQLKHSSGKMRFREMMRAFGRSMSQMHADVIHAHDLDTLIPCSKAAAQMDAMLVYDSHELYTESIHVAHRPFTKMIWRIVELSRISRADAVITVCQGIAEELKERYRLETLPHVVRNFSDRPELPADGSAPESLTEFKRFHSKCLLYQGYIQRGRGLDAALEALVGIPDWGLVICGQGPYETKLRERAQELHVEDQLLWMGQLDHDTLFSVTRSCDLGLCLIEPISLSYYYALPNKLIEYVQAGLPVVGSNLPEIKRIMNEYFIGWILKDDDDLQTLMKSFDSLKNDKKLEWGMSIAAESLNWQHEKMALLSVYSTLVK